MKEFLAISMLLLLIGCSNKDKYESIYEDREELLIGDFSTPFANNDAFGLKIEGTNQTDDIKFFTGDRLFQTTWVTSPASTTSLDGLGPTFNARSCANCHFKDGRGKPLISATDLSSNGFLMRLSIPGKGAHGEPLSVPNYGGQLQNKAILNIPNEGQVSVEYNIKKGTYSDGSTYELRKPVYTLKDLNFGALNNVLTSPRIGTQTIGLGFISAITEEDLLKNADESDVDNDGISGKANYVWNIEEGKATIGKYGWKANQPSVKQQVAGAFIGDMGLTSSLFPTNNCPSPQQDCLDAPNGGETEITDKQLERIVFYQSALAVPKRRNYKDNNVLQGKAIFKELKCITCHAVGFIAKKSELLPHIEGTIVNPYSDFLLHDMGEGLADHRPDFLATGSEWRTQPLWGIGLIKTVNKHTFLLHDGRARNIEEAILWHGGEAQKSKEDFKNLNKIERDQLIAFINSL